MTTEAWVNVAITLLGWVAVVAAMRNELKGIGKRLSKLEDKHDRLAVDFVPRPEVKAQLDSIERSLADVKGLLQVAVYSGRTKQHTHEG